MEGIRATIQAEIDKALAELNALSVPPQALVVALSGGKDSIVLLDVLAHLVASDGGSALPQLYAFHVNHGLSPFADDWTEHCAHVCAHRNIPFESASVTIQPKPRTSLEAQARSLRYMRLLEFTQQVNGALVTAHHLHDQMETMILQLKRGAGPKGLGSMQPLSFRDNVAILRPMLHIPQQAVSQYAHAGKLSWVEDESNTDQRFDRNFLRHHIIPALEGRWPSVSTAISRSAEFCHEQALLLEQVSIEKLGYLQNEHKKLSIAGLLALSKLWQKQILREWLRQFFPHSPSSAVLLQIQNMLTAREDSQPLVEIGEFSVRRFKGNLWCTNKFEHLPEQLHFAADGVSLPLWNRTLQINNPQIAEGERNKLTIVTGMPAVKVRPIGKLHNKLLKEWLKEWQIPPWERFQVPLIFYEDIPIAVCLEEKIVALQTPPNMPVMDFIYV